MGVEQNTGEVASQAGVGEAVKSFLVARAGSRERKELPHPLEVRQLNAQAMPAHRGAPLRSEGARALQEGARALQEGAERCSCQCPSPGRALPEEIITCSEEGRSNFMQFIVSHRIHPSSICAGKSLNSGR